MTTAQSHASAEAPDSLPGRMLLLLTDGICGLAVAAIVIVVLIQVAGRLVGSPLAWTEELTRACFIWMVFAGVAAGIRHADAARVTVLLHYFPKAIHRLALHIYVLCCLSFFLLSAWTGWYLVKQQVVMNERIATLGWPSWTIGIILPASAVLSIFGLIQSVRTHRAILAATEITP